MFVASLAILMAFGVEAMLPAFGEIDDEFGFADRGVSVSLLVTALLVGMAAGQLVWGPVSDRFGRRNALIAGFVLYAVGAAGTAVAGGLEMLLAARFVWGFGAAAPGGLRFAVTRDLFTGDRMARVVSIATAVFLIGPVAMPLIGRAILAVAPWQAIAWTGVALSVVGIVWTLLFGETLPVSRRRPLRLAPVANGVATVLRTRPSVGSIAASTFFIAAFFVYLGSAQPVIDRIYGRDAQFVWFFGAGGLVMSAGLVWGNRVIGAHGTLAVARATAAAFVVVGVAGLVLTLGAGGVPSIWVWFGWASVVNALTAILTAVCTALTLDPVGEVAGTASSVLGFSQLGVGAGLAAVIDALIDDTVTPMAVGALVFAVAGGLSLRWAHRSPTPR